MYKYLFFNDYSEGAHPSILQLLNEKNDEQETGYGDDRFCLQAKDLLKTALKNSDVDIHFVSGGTQANLIVLAALLLPYESVISAGSGHINMHEAGAIEATGHKINVVDSKDGKLHVDDVRKIIEAHQDEHMVKPKVVFISNATEVGTIYKKSELQELYKYCKENDLYLYLDGSRLGSALTSEESDVTLADLCNLVDVFYIGGTKNGALLGEAIVINNPELKPNFKYHLKQRGALMAKGRVLGIQFTALFNDDLYFKLAHHANLMAAKMKKGLQDAGFEFLTDSTTNQIFPILENKIIDELQKMYGFYFWSKVDKNRSAIRLVTSWATKEEKVEEFLTDLKNLETD